MSDTPQGFRPTTAAMAATAPTQTGRVPIPTQSAGSRVAPHRPAHATSSAPTEQNLPNIRVGYGTIQSFEFMQRVARALSLSDHIPLAFRARVPNKRKRDEFVENSSAISNCMVALTMAERMGLDVISVMWNLDVVEGRPSWRGQFVIALINSSGLYKHSLRYSFTIGEVKDYTYFEAGWDNGERYSRPKVIKAPEFSCIAWTMTPDGERVESEPITTEMCVAEGWYQKSGSKWQTMLGQMARYRSGAFFARVHCPQILYGLMTDDEVRDIIDAVPDDAGSWAVRADEEGVAVREDAGQEAKTIQQEGGQGEATDNSASPPALTHEQSGPTVDDLMHSKGDMEKAGVTVTDREVPPATEKPAGTSNPRLRNLFDRME